MANNLINTVSDVNYYYTVEGETTGTGVATGADVGIEVQAVDVTFTKTLTKQYATLGDSFTITYTVTNDTGDDLDSVVITDPLIGISTFTQQSITNGTVSGNTVTMTQTPETGSSDTVTISYLIGNTTVPSKTTYATEASAAISSPLSPVVTKTAYALLEINAAILTVTKTVNPTGPVPEGNVLTYTVQITNTGNVAASVGASQFVDSWTAGGFSAMTISEPTKFSVNIPNNTITNIAVLDIQPEQSVTYTLTGSCLVPSV